MDININLNVKGQPAGTATVQAGRGGRDAQFQVSQGGMEDMLTQMGVFASQNA